ncbi:MAG: carbohydrate kinase family protein [Bacteroidales bacterium]
MGRVFCIGETVFDIIFDGAQPAAGRAGGSMLNSAVSMGRMNLPVYFISEYGSDQLGKHIDDFLKSNGVNTEYIYRFSSGKTSVALAFLDEKRNASYAFYKDLPAERLAIPMPDFTPNDYVLFGSFYAINTEIRSTVLNLVSQARRAGTTIIYDPNFRKAHQHELHQLLPMIIENMQLASLVKASNEDMNMIFGTTNFIESYLAITPYCPRLIYTQGSNDVIFKSPHLQMSASVPQIEPLSTIGAGDSFSAGILCFLYANKLKHNDLLHLNADLAQKLLQAGIDFASNVCMSYDNYISTAFAQEYSCTIR